MANVNPVQAQKFLGGLVYPASKQDVVERAEQEGADENVRSTLESGYPIKAARSRSTRVRRSARVSGVRSSQYRGPGVTAPAPEVSGSWTAPTVRRSPFSA
jgi:hypothetical protein